VLVGWFGNFDLDIILSQYINEKQEYIGVGSTTVLPNMDCNNCKLTTYLPEKINYTIHFLLWINIIDVRNITNE
jgi:hypothetical protein